MALSALASTARFSVANTSDLKFSVTMAIIKIAEQVYSESGATAGHAARAVLATNVLNNPDGYAQRFTYIVASDPNAVGYTLANITDVQIEAAVSATWNAVAGA